MATETIAPYDSPGASGRQNLVSLRPPTRVTTSLLMPDCFAVRRQDGDVTLQHTLNGGEYWAARSFAKEVPPELKAQLERVDSAGAEREAVHRRTRRSFLEAAFVYLLHAPGSMSVALKDAGLLDVDGVKGAGIDVEESTDPAPLRMIFDPQSGRPLAVVARMTSASDPSIRTDSVLRLDDYRRVEGLMIPFRLERRLARSRVVTLVESVRVNVPLTRAAFTRTGDNRR